MADCPCMYVTPCHASCSCARPFMSAGCRRCPTYGSEEQRTEMAKHLAEVIDRAHAPIVDDDEDDADDAPGGEYGFIPLDGGRVYVRQSEIVGLKWIRQDHDHGHERTPRWTTTWYLQVSVTDVGLVNVYGDDIRMIMEVLGLPAGHPEGGYG